MNEGVAIDMGTPGATPVDSTGKPLEQRMYISMEMDKAHIIPFARSMSAIGLQNAADRACLTAGVPTQRANVFEKHPYITGWSLGVVTAVGAWLGVKGGIKLVQYIRNRNAMPQVTPAGRVIPMRATKP